MNKSAIHTPRKPSRLLSAVLGVMLIQSMMPLAAIYASEPAAAPAEQPAAAPAEQPTAPAAPAEQAAAAEPLAAIEQPAAPPEQPAPAEQPAAPAATAKQAAAIAPLAVPASEAEWDVNIVQGPGGTLSSDPEKARSGDIVRLYPSPDEGCGYAPGTMRVITNSQGAIRTVRGSGTEQDPWYFIMPDDSVTVSAEFVQYRSVKIANDGELEHGTINVDKPTAVKNDIVTITIAPDEGYRLKFNSSINNVNKSLALTDKDGNVIKYRVSGDNWNVDPTGPYTWTIPDYSNQLFPDLPRVDLNLEATTYHLRMPDCDILLNAEFAPAFDVTQDEAIENGSIAALAQGSRKAAVGEWVSNISATPEAGYRLVAGSVQVSDADGAAVEFNTNYAGFFMPAANVTVTAQFEQIPPLVVNPRVVSVADSEVSLAWTVHQTYASYNVYYRKAGAEGAWASKSAYIGGAAVGSEYTVVVDGLENDAEYEFYVAFTITYYPLAEQKSESLFATPTGIPPTGVTLFNKALEMPKGDSARLYADVAPADTKSVKLKWSSSNEAVATVDENSGEVAALATGTATITVANVANPTLSDQCVVTVKDAVANYDGRLEIGTAATDYDENGGHVYLPFTVTVPLKAPIVRVAFDFGVPGNLVNGVRSETSYKINGISLGGATLAQGDNVIGDTNVKMDRANRPYYVGNSLYNPPTNIGWGSIQPASGKFLKPGAVYEFLLDVEILPTAPAAISFGYSSTLNNRGFFAWSYQSPTSPSMMQGTQVTGLINASWQGSEPTLTAQGYSLLNKEDFLWYVEKWNTDNSFTAGAVLAGSDITLAEGEFDGLGTQGHPFAANFMGNGRTVTYVRTVAADGAAGFINYMSSGSVNSLTVKGSITATAGDVCIGGIVGKISGSAYVNSGCKSYVDITATGSSGGYVGGIAGFITSTSTSNLVNGGKNYGAILADGTGILAAGGIIGAVIDSNGNIGGGDSENQGNVTGRGYVGGIVGLAQWVMPDNTNGNANNKGVWENKNYGNVTALSGQAAGGIVGKIANAHLGGSYTGAGRTYGNYNYGAVTGSVPYVGGIAGLMESHKKEFASVNYNGGRVENTSGADGAYAGVAYVGGIIGYLDASELITVGNNINKGEIVALGQACVKGGIVAEVSSDLLSGNCYGNYYVETEGLGDAVRNTKTAPSAFLSENGYAPSYTQKGDEDGSAEKPFIIADLFDFLWFQSQVNDKSGGLPFTSPGRLYCVQLTADLDLTDYPAFSGIGTVWGSYPLQSFDGTFDGGGHTITLALDGGASGAASGDTALFRYMSGGVIKNLTIAGSVKSAPTSGNAAGVALMCDGTVFENVVNRADVQAFANAAGIANGRPYSLENVENYGKIIGGNAAGLANNMYGVGFIRNCANYGDVTGAGMAAGLVGLLAGGNKSKDRIPSFYVDGVVNNGNVTSSSAAVKDALAWYNAGDWTSNHTAAGIIGKIEGVIVDIRNAVNNGTVIGSGNNVGGIVGVINHTGGGGDAENYTDTDVRIYDSVNNGDIMGTHNGDDSGYLEQISVGGIVGNTAGDFGSTGVAGPNAYYPGQTENVIISGCQNNGDISGPEGANVGAIVGLTSNEDSGKVIIDDSKNFNTGTVDGGGGKWAEQAHNGTTYDPSTHEVIDGQLVEKKPPVGPGVDPDPDPDPDPGEDPDPGANPDLGDPDPGANPDPGPGTPDPGDPDPGPGTPDPGEQPDPGETPPPVDNGETPPPVDNSQTPPPAGSTPPPAQDAAPPAAQAPAAAQASADAPAVTVDNRPAASSPQPTQEAVPEEIEPDPVPQDSLLGSEVTLTPVPLGLGFQSVANTILTIAVGAVALGILVVAGFTFWRMYRRRVA